MTEAIFTRPLVVGTFMASRNSEQPILMATVATDSRYYAIMASVLTRWASAKQYNNFVFFTV